MIDLFGLFGLAAFVVASVVVGIRILLLAARTRLLPETMVGSSLFLAGGVGTGLMIGPLLLTDLSLDTRYVVQQLASAFSHLGYALLYVFVWRVFRPGETWAKVLFAVCTGALLAGGAGLAIEMEPGDSSMSRSVADGVWFWLSLASRFVGYGWAAIESFRYYAMLKRRLVLGLAESEVVNRFLHWGICTTAVFCIWVNAAVQPFLSEEGLLVSASNLVSALLGFVVAGTLWLAFFPKGRGASEAVSGSAAREEVSS